MKNKVLTIGILVSIFAYTGAKVVKTGDTVSEEKMLKGSFKDIAELGTAVVGIVSGCKIINKKLKEIKSNDN